MSCAQEAENGANFSSTKEFLLVRQTILEHGYYQGLTLLHGDKKLRYRHYQ